MTRLTLTILCLLYMALPAVADQQSRLRDGGPASRVRLAGTEPGIAESKVYIVQLREPAAAALHAANARRVMQKPGAGTLRSAPRFDKNSAVTQSHVQRLENAQAGVISKAGGSIEQLYSYRYALNGFAARMTAAQRPTRWNTWTRSSQSGRTKSGHWPRPTAPAFSTCSMGATACAARQDWTATAIIIGVIDSGIAPEHPSLQDTRPVDRPSTCWSTWADATLLGQVALQELQPGRGHH